MHCEKLATLKTEVAIQVLWYQSAISKITIWTCSKKSNCSSKPKKTDRDDRQQNRILISNRFANYGEIFKAWNDAGVVVSLSITLWRRHQLGYDSRIPISKLLLIFKYEQKHSIWARDHQNTFVNQWNQVIFHDESKFCISYGVCGWRKSYVRYDAKCIK